MYEHKTIVGKGLVSPDQLDEIDAEGWELIQIVPYSEGVTGFGPGEFAFYFRRAKGTMQ